MRLNPFDNSIGLALGGGAAKGIAHIGVLKAFEEEQLEIDYIAGTSIGALVAAYYAFGKSIDEITKVAERLDIKSMTSFSLMRSGGFFTTDGIRKMILSDLGDVRIESANIPLAICTADILTGEQVAFESGSLVDAVCASMAVPGLFSPVKINGRTLVDGGIVENVPVSLIDAMGAGIIVAVDLNGVERYPEPDGMLDIIGNAIDICMDRKTRTQLKLADVVISLDLSSYSRTDNKDRVMPLLYEGYYPTKAKLQRVVIFRRANLIRYAIKVLRKIVPFKVPVFIVDLFKPHLQRIRFK